MQMTNAQDLQAVLTIRDIASILKCSKTHVANVINGKVSGIPRLAHIAVGRRKLVRREWFHQWLEESKARC
jgi:excisionase family DNA binding protein